MSSAKIEQAKIAAQFLMSLEGTRSSPLDKRLLTELGQIYWEHTYRYATSDVDADRRLNDLIEELALTNPDAAAALIAMSKLPDIVTTIFAAARWYDQGLPIVRLGHKRAAALMATTIPEDMVSKIRPPFRAFFIEMPDGLLELRDHDGTPVKATGIIVHVVEFHEPLHRDNGDLIKPGHYWRWIVTTKTPLTQWQINRTVEEMLGSIGRGNDWVGVGLPIEEYDERLAHIVGRLVCSVCLMMSNPEDLKEKKELLKSKPGQKKADKNAPVYRVFVEGRATQVDVRSAVSSYLKGERETLHMRLLVRGHWKMQPHGPKHSLRRLQWIEPYWAHGVEGDPILQRPHKLGDKA